MTKTLIITKKQENELNQIYNELVFSVKKTYTEEDLLKLSYMIFKESSKNTYNSKKEIAKDIFKGVKKGAFHVFEIGKEKVADIKKSGFEKVLKNDGSVAIIKLKSIPKESNLLIEKLKEKAINFHEDFLKKTRDEKIELISVGLMGLFIFFASAGGNDIEGGIPDSDLNFGIGNHRHFISHSILMGFIVEFLMRAGVVLLNKSYKNLPSNHHLFWDKSNRFINNHQGIAIGAMWAGIGAHLLKDSGIFGHGVKPYTGLPIEMSMEAHKGLFAANGIAAGIIGYSVIKRKS